MVKKEEIVRMLRESGCRLTKQRALILDTILEEREFCCKEIYFKALKKNRNIGSATVYRMINALEEQGVVERSSSYKVVELQGQHREQHQCCQHELDYHEIIECITCALDAKDAYTAGHSQRVSDMATKVCQLMGMKEDDVEKIHIAAHLHDIGKIGVPDAVLNKIERLNDEEWQAIRKHPSIGAEILSKSHHLSELKDIVLAHHERYDGKGYPQGLKGEAIPVGARIIAICDSIDAMTSTRSYRKAHDFQFCYGEIEKNLGIMYDPIIGKYVLEHWEEIICVVKSD